MAAEKQDDANTGLVKGMGMANLASRIKKLQDAANAAEKAGKLDEATKLRDEAAALQKQLYKIGGADDSEAAASDKNKP
jgi:hypothetical protein